MIFLSFLIMAVSASSLNVKTFPENFLFGVGSSAYQVEGAWNSDGKSINIWDHFIHTQPDRIIDMDNADIACDSYNKTEEDVAILKSLGVDCYRFSLSWSRILPSSLKNNVNEIGIRYYNQLINLLIENNIQPLVTLYHWDLPQELQDLGGFANSLIIESFVEFAKVAFEHFGDRVKLWTTFNQPKTICLYGYGNTFLAPGINFSGVAEYMCGHNLLKAHAAVYHLYNNTYKSKQKGRLSIVLDGEWYEPASNSNDDIKAAERALQFTLGWYAHPIYTNIGNYPNIMVENIEKLRKQEKSFRSRLPTFTKHEIEYIRGTSDFFSLNHYRTFLAANKDSEPDFYKDANVQITTDPSWPTTAFAKNKVVPWGLSKLLKWIKEEYGDPDIYITENGYADLGELEDTGRLYLGAVLNSIHQDKIRVIGYTLWSLLDNFEWIFGYSVRFGLHHVDFLSPNRTRTPKTSAEYYKQIIKSRKLP